jgi:hypothetical protein
MRNYLVSLAILGGAALAARRRRRGKSPTRPGPIPGSGKYALDIVCDSTYQNALDKLVGSTREGDEVRFGTAMLILEGSDLFETNRVRVEIDDRTVGYLALADAIKYRDKQPAKVMSVSALIVGDRESRDAHYARYGVKLDLLVD